MASFKELFERLLSWHYYDQGLFGEGRGQDFFDTLGEKVDEVMEWWKAATTASFVNLAPADALAYVLQNYNLERPELFTDNQARTMAGDAWNIWERSGAHEGILTEVRRLGFPNCAIIPVWQWKRRRIFDLDEIRIQPTLPREPDHNPLFLPNTLATKVLPPKGTDTEWGPGWWKELNLHWSSFWLVINPPHSFGFRRWGDPWMLGDGSRWDAVVAGDRIALRRLFLTLRKMKCGNFSCRGVVFSYPGFYAQEQTIWSVRTWASYQAIAVGSNGTALHWDGNAWTAKSTGVTDNLFSVWGRNASDVWAVGQNGRILHFNGQSWSTVTSPTGNTLTGVAGAGMSVWACGAAGTLLRWNGTAWAVVPPVNGNGLLELLALGVDEVWAVGNNGTALRWDGVTWAATATGVTESLYGVWGKGPGEIWAGGDNGTMVRWNGAAWSQVNIPSTGSVSSIWGTADGKALATVRPDPTRVGQLMTYDGAGTWAMADTNVKTNPAIGSGHLWGVHGTNASNFWAVGDGGLWWCSEAGKIYWSAPWGGFQWGDGTRYYLNYAIKRLREPWE